MSTIDLPVIRQRIDVDGSALDGLSSKMGGIAGTIGKGVAAGAAVGAAAVGAFAVKGVKSAVDVERGVREVVTLFGETGAAADEMTSELSAGVSELSSEVGLAQSEITSGLYSAISAGVPRDNAFDFMRVASQASIAGVTDVETAVDGLSTTINAFGLDASESQAVADSMFAAVQGGKTTFEELSASLFNVAPAAAGLGIEFGDVNAAIATLTASGTPTSVATTQMRAALSELGKSGSKAGDAFTEISGSTFPEFIAQGGTLEEALAMMGDAADGNATALSNMFGSVEAGAAASQLGITNAEKFGDELARQEDSAGAATDAYETMDDGAGRAMERIKIAFDNAATTLGTALLPALATAAEWLGDRLPGWIDTATAALKPLIAGFRAVYDTVAPIIRNIVERFRGGGESMGATGGKIGEIFDKVGAVVSRIGDTIALVVGWIAEVWDRYGEQIMASVRTTFDAIMAIISGVLDVIIGIFDVVLGILTGDWSRAWEGIKSILSGVWEAIQGIVSQAINGVRTMIGLGLAIIATVFGDIWDSIVGGITGAWESITGAVSSGIDAIKGYGQDALDWFRELPGRILDALGNVGELLLDAGRNIIQGLIDGITAKIDAVRDTISSVTSTIRRFLPFSPAREGPLSGRGAPDRAGAKIGEMLADGIASSRSQVRRETSRLAAVVDRGMPSAPSLGASVLPFPSGPNGARAAQSASESRRGGPAFRDLVIHNPSAEPSEESVDRQMRRLAHLGIL